ncbi:arylsulfatase [Roseobacter litoralis]|uniref:Arylsulfatase n=1 Tax=Roseobacter litoralis (strain ATCC 49566 / DSM 6996 / JCM 21268 / NBRC 15278 / OCh 149) TaxID=391595 RepID=F7ZLJ8_ROSLO|nr:arylsulfatase [Roseobacter litoralis]AEI94049.1 putative arylsulfatase [Roseobacter litoralis Och 149]
MQILSRTAGPLIGALVTTIVGMSAAIAQEDRPNILVIMADDVGWASLGSYHQGIKSIETPNLDQLASDGMRLTDYYAEPSCTAGRSAFLTGQFPVRVGMHTVGLPGDPVGLSDEDPTIADMLKSLGYSTGQFGKNHLGDQNQFLPTTKGFDEYWGWLYHLNAMEYASDPDWPDDPEFEAEFGPRNIIHSYAIDEADETVDPRWGPVGKQRIVDDGPAPPERQKTLDNEVTAKTIDFIDRAVEGDTPFFVWMAPARAHVWTHLSPEYEAMLGNGRGLQDVVMKELDDNVGKVLARLDELGQRDNTIVVFTSDNGPETMTWPDGGTTPFRGEKGTTWEGGFRVPAIIRWPGKVPEGRVGNGIFSGMDWMPTLVAAAGGPDNLPEELLTGFEGYRVHLDGYNQLSYLTGGEESNRDEIIYYEGTNLQAIRYKDWKAHFVVQHHGWGGPKDEMNAPLLINLRRDPYEKAFDESGMYVNWMGKKMWAFGPAARLVQRHLKSFEEFPPRGSVVANQAAVEKQISSEGGMSQ